MLVCHAAGDIIITSIIITLGCLLLAVVFTIIAKRRPSCSGGARFAWAGLIAIYGVCVGIVSATLVYFFSLSEWAALAISIPLGVPAGYAAAKISEA